MTELDHFGEIRRREHYQGIACLAARQVPLSPIVTRGKVHESDVGIMELLLSETAVQS